MNSKKKITVLGLIFFYIFFIHNISSGQQFTPLSPTSPTFGITLPSLSSLNTNQISPLPYYTLFLEYGDGRYIRFTNPIYNEYVTNPKIITYPFSIPANSASVLNIVGHYDTFPPPLRQHTIPNSNTKGSGTPPNQDSLPANKKIRFDYSDRTIVPGDTMTVAITYKPELRSVASGDTGNYLVAFFYNDEYNGGKFFDQINSPVKVYPFTGGSTKVIRNHSGEVVYTPEIPTVNFPNGMSNILDDVRGTCRNAVYFMIPAGASTDEKNIFISLAPSISSSVYTKVSSTRFSAVIIKYNILAVVDHMKISDDLMIVQKARDPNGILTFPRCLDSFPTGPYNKPIKYQVDFQNDGSGQAKEIEVTVTVPKGIQMPSGSLNVTSTVSGRQIFFTKKTNNNFPFPNTYRLIKNATEQKIIFRMNNINLPGIIGGALNDIARRHGSISFTLNTIIKDFRKPMPNCMYSDVKIVFISTGRGGDITNPAITGSDLIRKYCKHVSFPDPCTRDYVVPRPPL